MGRGRCPCVCGGVCPVWEKSCVCVCGRVLGACEWDSEAGGIDGKALPEMRGRDLAFIGL